MSVSVDGSFPCSFCSCVFFSESDLAAHVRRFGAVKHSHLLSCVHLLLEVDGYNAGIDGRGDWSFGGKRLNASVIGVCRVLVAKGAKRHEQQPLGLND